MEFTSSLFSAGVFLAFFYLILFLTMLKKIWTSPPFRRLSSYFSIGIFFTLFLFFSTRGLWIPVGNAATNEFIFLLLGIMPGGLFIFLRRETAMLTSMQSSSEQRFDQLKDEFLTVASHELRTPLSVINGFAEILVREKLGTLNDEQKRRVRKILMQGQRLNRIIDELLDMSRIRSGKIVVKKEVFAIVPVLRACLDDQQVVCEQQRIQLIDNLPDFVPDVSADLERVTQVVVNLLGNAIKYTPSGGEVRVQTSYEKHRNRVRVEVIDTGIGIDPKEQPHVFAEFYRVTSQTGSKYKGSGLGLSIVKQLVEAMKGSVGVKSKGVGKGSMFYFTLPAAS